MTTADQLRAHVRAKTSPFPELYEKAALELDQRDDTIATLRAMAQRRLELIRKCEWSGDTIRGYCPICTTLVKGHHSINCPLAKELEAK